VVELPRMEKWVDLAAKRFRGLLSILGEEFQQRAPDQAFIHATGADV